MKISLFLIAATAAASLAAPVHFGIDGKVGYNALSLGDDLGAGIVAGSPESKASFGAAVGPVVALDINDQFAVAGGVYFLYDLNRYDNSFDLGALGSHKEEHTIHQMSLGLQFAPIFRLSEFFSVKVGYEWDIPLAGTSETKNTTTVGTLSTTSTDKPDIVWAPNKLSDVGSNEAPVLSTHNLIVGGAYQLTPGFALALQAKIALTGSVPFYKTNGDLDGGAGTKSNMMVHQLAVGVNLGV